MEQANWWYEANGDKQGPVTFDRLLELLIADEVNTGTLVWCQKLDDWSALGSIEQIRPKVLEVLRANRQETPPPLPSGMRKQAQHRVELPAVAVSHAYRVEPQKNKRGVLTVLIDSLPPLGLGFVLSGFVMAIAIPAYAQHGHVSDWGVVFVLALVLIAVMLLVLLQPKTYSGSVSQAWKRFIAKLIDISLASVVASLAVLVLGASDLGNAIIFMWALTLLFWLFLLEGLLLSQTGTTLGRKIIGIQLKCTETEKGTGGDPYLQRALKVMAVGLGFGIPFVGGLIQAVAYKRFRETGTTRWDDKRFSVTCRPIGFGRVILALIVLLFLSVLSGAIGKSVGRSIAMHGNAPDWMSAFPNEKEQVRWEDLTPVRPESSEKANPKPWEKDPIVVPSTRSDAQH